MQNTSNKGTSGHRNGFKIFSINTTIRNPKRNPDFLRYLKKYDGKLMDDTNLYRYFFEIVKNGVYTFSTLSESVKQKLENDIELTDAEVIEAIRENPQATGLSGRVMTQLRAIKEQGFIQFIQGAKRKVYIKFTKLGNQLIDENIDQSIVYTKAMLGTQANSPVRPTVMNLSNPFLNTLFVINEVKKQWTDLGYEAKGILTHEFGTFVLSMHDCDYKKAAQEIINYRKKFKYEINEQYIKDYLKREGILPYAMNTIIKDYPDDVFRKFEMTELIVKRGKNRYVYYDFSQYNIEKINLLLEKYKNYEHKQFDSPDEYFNHMAEIVLPWEQNENLRRRIVKSKAEVLGIPLNPSWTLEQSEEFLDRSFYSSALSKAIKKYSDKSIIKELLILSGSIKAKSTFDDISEPLRLEYLLALIIGKKYGTKGLISNIIYNEDGLPLHCAPASKSDIIFHHENGSYILEPTMQRGRQQQLNSETTNIVRHVKNEENQTGVSYRVMMIAPVVHPDVVDYFQYKASKENAKITTLSIERSTGLFYDSVDVLELNTNFDKIISDFLAMTPSNFTDLINNYKFKLEKIQEVL